MTIQDIEREIARMPLREVRRLQHLLHAYLAAPQASPTPPNGLESPSPS